MPFVPSGRKDVRRQGLEDGAPLGEHFFDRTELRRVVLQVAIRRNERSDRMPSGEKFGFELDHARKVRPTSAQPSVTKRQ